MRFFRTAPGIFLIAITVVALAVFCTMAALVYGVTHPTRVMQPLGDLETVLVEVEEIEFFSSDGVPLSGWLMTGREDLPPIVLAHDLGESKAAHMNLAIRLRKIGFTVLSFDLRAHGFSGGSGSGLGIAEKRDVIGAVDYLLEDVLADHKPDSVGVYGVGMGAHACVLAALDRPSIRVLVLDGLYPDASHVLEREIFRGWDTGSRFLGFLPTGAYCVLSRSTIGGHRAADALPRLLGRDMLMVAPAGDTRLATEIQAMYRSVPEQQDADANLVTLPSTGTGTLYGADRGLYQEKVALFLANRLGGPELVP